MRMKHMGSLGRMRREVMGLWILLEVGLGVVINGGIGGVMGLSFGMSCFGFSFAISLQHHQRPRSKFCSTAVLFNMATAMHFDQAMISRNPDFPYHAGQ
jgi:hypothetical protein